MGVLRLVLPTLACQRFGGREKSSLVGDLDLVGFRRSGRYRSVNNDLPFLAVLDERPAATSDRPAHLLANTPALRLADIRSRLVPVCFHVGASMLL